MGESDRGNGGNQQPTNPIRRHHLNGDRLEIEAARNSIAASLFSGLPSLPTSVGRYLLTRRIGTGGMGIVFAAKDPSLRRELAIKLLHPTRESREDNQLLLAEAQSAAQVVHPCVITIFDAGLHEDRVFVAMELIDGQPLSQWLHIRPSWRHGAAALASAARGIAAAHNRGIIHRDFKPGNVLLGVDGRVCVVDFGLAKEVGMDGLSIDAQSNASTAETLRATTRLGEVVGTPPYMAPEQYLGTTQDERTDQFAFCVSLYEVIWQKLPFEGATFGELRESILRNDPRVPNAGDVPVVLIDAITRGLSKNRSNRFDHMSEIADLLESLTKDIDLSSAFREGESIDTSFDTGAIVG